MPVGFRDAVVRSIERPAIVVKLLVESLGRMILGREKPQLTGPVGIVREAKRAAAKKAGKPAPKTPTRKKKGPKA